MSTRLITGEKAVNSILIKIEGNGPGFPKEFPVFEPFNSTYPQRTGLGLATVKETIEAHGGTIRLIEKDGGGACFEILLNISGDIS
jgi:signal transduction histidine kinase